MARLVSFEAVELSIFIGDIAAAPAEAVCTSTNPRLSLVMGTGASVRGRGGFEILRECEAIIDAEERRTGKRLLPPGSAHVTTAGSLDAKIVIHCVASDAAHHSSAAIVRACTERALSRAAELGCSSVAMPLFATGHAHVPFEEALAAMADALASAPSQVRHVMIVIGDAALEGEVRRIVGAHLPGVRVNVISSDVDAEEPVSWLDDDYRM